MKKQLSDTQVLDNAVIERRKVEDTLESFRADPEKHKDKYCKAKYADSIKLQKKGWMVVGIFKEDGEKVHELVKGD